ncbi:RNA polymerase sigma factor [Brevundimonas sp.]|uniref:RNA polymerase sigma factor n=1 Tax=Brevundimonas sp. TaxID=1871086 RepID=UPI0028A0277A|nr:RNA polymerase sigma factor [Brevundimonas sp.]
MTAPAAHPLVAAYLEQRQDLARFCRARLGGASGDVDDLLQDLYLKVSTLPADTPVDNPRAFLFRLISNLMLDRWRSGQRAAARDGAWRQINHQTGVIEDLDDAPSAEAAVASRQRLARLIAAVETLPPKTRTIFRLHKFDGVSYADIASQLDISRSSVEKHMMEALRVLARKAQP